MTSKLSFIHISVKSLRTMSSAFIVEVFVAYNILHAIHRKTLQVCRTDELLIYRRKIWISRI